MFYQSGFQNWWESNIMCSNGVLYLNADQYRLRPGSTTTEFMVLAPAAVTNMVMTMAVMIMTIYHHHHQQQRR